jgi:hypothetical protein
MKAMFIAETPHLVPSVLMIGRRQTKADRDRELSKLSV